MKEVTRTFLKNVNFQMDTDWKLGFTGRNGRGKTTFLKLLTGQMQYSGSIDASVDFEYFPYSVQNPEDFAVDVIREIAPAAEDWRIHRELSVLGAEEALYRPFAQLSFGEQTKILLTALFLRENLFLLIDEPTNHLDEEGRRLLASYLKKKKGFILVSHDRAFLDGCIDHILAINKKNIEVQKGNFSSWYAVKEMQDNSEIAENERLKKDIRRLENSARRTSEWSDRVESSENGTLNSGLKQDKGYVGHKAAKMMSRSKSIENRKIKAAEEKEAAFKKRRIAEGIENSSSRLSLRSGGRATECVRGLRHRAGRLLRCQLFRQAGGAHRAQRRKRIGKVEYFKTDLRGGYLSQRRTEDQPAADHFQCSPERRFSEGNSQRVCPKPGNRGISAEIRPQKNGLFQRAV